MSELANKVSSNFIWRILEKFGAQAVTLVVSIILARILDPVIYGTVAIITVITTILSVFVEGGFGTALVQKKNADNLDFSTVFWFNLAVCIFLFGLLFFLAPLISNFFNLGDLTNLIRVSGIIILISGVKSIQIAYVSRNLLFKKFFFATLGGTIVSAGVGIYMAYAGYGVWALVVQNLVNQAIDTIILWILVRWRPSFSFSFKRFKGLFGFGWKFLASGLLNQTYNQLSSLIIGKKYSPDDLAFYNRGVQFPQFIGEGINYGVDNVLLPVVSQAQDDKERVKNMTRKSVKIGSFITWPCMIGLAACSTPFVRFFLKDKWLPAVPFLILFCFVYGLLPTISASVTAIKALGKSRLFLILEIAKKIIGLALLLVTMWFGVFWIAIGVVVSSILALLIHALSNKKLLNYSFSEQAKDFFPSLLLSLIMGALVYLVSLAGLSDIKALLIQVLLGVIIYMSLAKILKMDSYEYCVNIFKSLFLKRKTKE